MHALTGWRITQRNEVVGMSGSGGTFVLVATYPDEAAARGSYQAVSDAHAAGLAGSCDAAAVTTDASSMARENKDETATRHGAGWGVAAGRRSGSSSLRRSWARPRPAAWPAASAGTWPGGSRGQGRDSPATSPARARPGSSQPGREGRRRDQARRDQDGEADGPRARRGPGRHRHGLARTCQGDVIRVRCGQRRCPGHPARGAAASPASGVGLPDCRTPRSGTGRTGPARPTGG